MVGRFCVRRLRSFAFGPFNVQVETVSKSYFVGLPIPGAASMVATTVLFTHPWKVSSSTASTVPLLFATYVLGFLMVSTVPYYSFKDVEVIKGKVLLTLFVVIVCVSIIAIKPGMMLFLLLLTYLISGPVVYVMQRRKAEVSKSEQQSESESTPDQITTDVEEDRSSL